ncbi:50S ribosomal protein L25/general stress protein Ctc [Corynebacterium terpenotabidum]|uniref:Large ribosomal subunit protein bL25 n=1 Tax=Corynebacterium terpenotabidum Y-11 TaxID=1200352 RepID=S4XFD5_9CORY|nr:50S ribosomal protein L25/general stress protein Ctc [Corynebacterium terpenotabidum]AGP31261.1 50S ribosomal protein L25/general stress protein Ctc [Corynebacterium terpenotabidum Y-11]
MSTDITTLAAQARNEFGKGASRRLRVAGRVPAVIYASHQEPIHVSLDRLELTAAVRKHGSNALLSVDAEGEDHLVLIKAIDQNVLTLEIDHIDLLAVNRNETVDVDVHVIVSGEPAPGVEYIQDADTITIEANVLNIPEELTAVLDGKEIGDQILASDIALPEGTTLVSDADLLVVNFIAPENNAAEADAAAASATEAPAEEAAAESAE